MKLVPAWLALSLVACASPAPEAAAPETSASAEPAEPEGPPQPIVEKVETGSTCAAATAECLGNGCTVKLKNDCDAPITCTASIMLRCRMPTDIIEARGRGRQTFPAKTEGELPVVANCTMGNLVSTNFSELSCSGGETPAKEPTPDTKAN